MKYLLIVSALIVSLHIKAQENPYNPDNLIYNSFDIEDNDDFSSFNMMDSIVADYNVFFIGENHQYRVSNSKQQIKMFKYLHKTVGAKNLCLEFGYSRGYLINQYVQTGDTTILKDLDNFTYDEYVKFYKELYEFNQTLSEDDKITIYGIDLERSYLTSVRLMMMQLPENKKVPEELKLSLEALKSLDGYNTDIWEKYNVDKKNISTSSRYYGHGRYNANQYNQLSTLNGVIENFEENDSIYKTYLGSNYNRYNRIVEGLKLEADRISYTNKGMMQARILREKFMYDKFSAIVDSLPGEKFFGEFGRCHTPTEEMDEWCTFYHFKSLASRINNSDNEFLKNKVMSIGAYYPKNESFDENFKIANLYKVNKELKKEEISLVYVSSDTNYFNDILQNFKFLIINNKTIIDEFDNPKEKTEENFWTKEGYKNDYWHFDGLYGLNKFKLTELNAQFVGYGLPELPSIQDTYGGAITVYPMYNAFTRFSFLTTKPYQYSIGDTANLTFKSNQFMWHVGGNPSSLEAFSLAPNFGLGFQNVSLKIEDWFNNPSLVSQGEFFTSAQQTENDLSYKNNAVILDLAMDVRLNIKFISLGVFAGYQFDVSQKSWRDGFEKIVDSPRTSYSGWHVHGSIAIFLHN